jgi:hypothetical protein
MNRKSAIASEIKADSKLLSATLKGITTTYIYT